MNRISLSFLVILFVFCVSNTMAQGVAVNEDNSTADVSAIMDVKSITKGMLIPRMTSAERTAIGTPAEGLFVYDKTTSTFWFHDGSVWVEQTSEPNDDVNDADASATNEIQVLSIVGNIVSLSNGGGSVTVNVSDADSDPANEIQTLSSSASGTNRTIILSNGGGSTTISVADNDNNSSNELQTLSKSGSTVTLSNGGGSVTDAVNDADSDPNNEIQNLSSSSSGTNRTINISGATGTTINVADNDNSSSNELQNLSITGSTISLSNGGGSVTVPSSSDNLGNHTATTNLNMTNHEIDNVTHYDVTPGTDYGLRFWSSDDYSIKMGNNQQDYGWVTDYSIHSNMGTIDNRGFTWGYSRTNVVTSLEAETGHFRTRGVVYAENYVNTNNDYRMDGQTIINASKQLAGGLLTWTDARYLGQADNLGNHIATTGIKRNNHNTGFLEGSYNNVGANDTRTNPIYTIGSSYNPSTTALNNMYGVGFSHSNFWGTASARPSGWGLYVAADGDARIILEASSGRIWAASDVRAPRFYDINNTAFYTDPASISRVNEIEADNGSVSDPSYYFAGDANTGFYQPADNQLGITINGSEAVRINASRYVGIGTTAPSSSLDLIGRLEVDGNVFLDELQSGYGGSAQSFNFSQIGVTLASNYSESGGFHADGNQASIWSPGDASRILRIYDEDGMVERAYFDASGTVYSDGFLNISDRRIKKDIQTISSSLALVKQLNGVTYNMRQEILAKGEIEDEKEMTDPSITQKQYGFIAQEVEVVIPELVTTDEMYGFDDFKAVNYQGIIPVLVEAMKEQQTMIEALQAKLAELESKIND